MSGQENLEKAFNAMLAGTPEGFHPKRLIHNRQDFLFPPPTIYTQTRPDAIIPELNELIDIIVDPSMKPGTAKLCGRKGEVIYFNDPNTNES